MLEKVHAKGRIQPRETLIHQKVVEKFSIAETPTQKDRAWRGCIITRNFQGGTQNPEEKKLMKPRIHTHTHTSIPPKPHIQEEASSPA